MNRKRNAADCLFSDEQIRDYIRQYTNGFPDRVRILIEKPPFGS